MSVTPQNLPKRTRVLVKDLLFQEKYLLTNTQVDIMSYIFNAFTWAIKKDGYLILTNKKITNDLPQIGEKTLEASLRELEDKGLIEKSIVKIPNWGNARVRGIKITSCGMEYNSSLYSPSHQEIVSLLQERIDELLEQLKTKEKQGDSESEALAPKEEIVEDKNEAKAVDSKTKEDFIIEIRNRFLLNSQPLCNKVEGWEKESTFYINSYGRLSLCTKNMDFKQISNPIEVNKFWEWLFEHQERVGEVFDFQKLKEDVAKLNKKYKNRELNINGKTRWIEELISIDDGVAIKVRDEHGNINVLANAPDKPMIYALDVFEEHILKWEVKTSQP